MILAVDFDMVIHDPTNKEPGYKMGKPIPGSQLVLQLLHDRSATIIVHTLWGRTPEGIKAVEKWLKYFKIPFDEVTALKPKADMYLDDHGYQFTSWQEVLPALDKLL